MSSLSIRINNLILYLIIILILCLEILKTIEGLSVKNKTVLCLFVPFGL